MSTSKYGGITHVSYETIRRWINKFGLTYAKRVKRGSDKPSPVGHLDEVFVRIGGKQAMNDWDIITSAGTW